VEYRTADSALKPCHNRGFAVQTPAHVPAASEFADGGTCWFQNVLKRGAIAPEAARLKPIGLSSFIFDFDFTQLRHDFDKRTRRTANVFFL
jgi:hypothetical protein